AIASALTRNKPSLVIAGGAAASGPDATQLQYVVSLLNAALGNVGKTVRFGPDWAYGKATPYAEVAKLVQAMAAGEIEVLLLGPGVNPAFTLPGGLKAADAIKKVPFVVSFGNLPDETTTLAHLILPDTHWLGPSGGRRRSRRRPRRSRATPAVTRCSRSRRCGCTTAAAPRAPGSRRRRIRSRRWRGMPGSRSRRRRRRRLASRAATSSA